MIFLFFLVLTFLVAPAIIDWLSCLLVRSIGESQDILW